MAMRPRNTPPPYQVMKPCPPVLPGSPDRSGEGTGAASNSPPAAYRSGLTQWLARSNQPVTVRVPRGFVFLLGVIFVLVLLISYWVGDSRGYRRGLAEGIAGSPILPSHHDNAGNPSTAGGSTSPNTGGGIRINPGATTVIPGADARQKGLNYVILAHYPEAQLQEVRTMVQFLWSQGVEAQAVKRHNSRSFQVLALQGFTREELGSAAMRQYQQRLRDLGRLWKSRKPGTTDWSGMYLDRFDGEPADLVITREN